ncbi:MAG: enoyl-CoA hydratase [Acidimicrobiia bacterium]|nr:enoyl-CoA hydratase [Acidimicrobiia bacterium]
MTAPDSPPDAPPADAPALLTVAERVATITLNRPAARNALSSDLLRLLPQLLTAADADPHVDVLILTGADPAFCAGLDLNELGSSAANLGLTGSDGGRRASGVRGPFPRLHKPLIGAVNGAAVTGGFELALNCDFLVASERAKFGDTHTRVGVMPAWGMTVLLPQAIGIRRAREMSFSGNFMSAAEALQWGLVNHVVPHDELLPFTRALALDIAGNDAEAVRQIRSTYAATAHDDDAWEQELRDSRAWQRTNFSPDKVAARRAAVQARGRSQ